VSARVLTFQEQGMQLHVSACVKKLARATWDGPLVAAVRICESSDFI
jgi:hypothetical protein